MKFIFLFLVIVLASELIAQPRGRGVSTNFSGTVRGRIVDAETGNGMPYANVALYSVRDNKALFGDITDSQGAFIINDVKTGMYYAQLKFIGYETHRLDSIFVSPRNPEIDLGEIVLNESSFMSDEVKVEADKPAMEYKIDRKVVNVEDNYSTLSGSAIDVLENVPAVSVDIEGNVSLRGSGSFMVLIDGKPTVLETDEALRQIPASTISQIEIITNPSAKFDPDGTSGIMNIVTKKQKLKGMSGIFNLNGGLDDKYGGDVLMSYKYDGLKLFIGGDYSKEHYPGTSNSERITTKEGIFSYINSEGNSARNRNNWSLRSGIEYSFTESDNIVFEAIYGYRKHEGLSDLYYESWSDPDKIINTYDSYEDFFRSGNHYSFNFNYNHNFGETTHELKFQADFRHRGGEEESLDELVDNNGEITSGRKNTEYGPSDRFQANLDYTLPFNETDKFEAGYQTRIGVSDEETTLLEYDTLSNRYNLLDEYNNATIYDRDIHALYSLYAGETGSFGYQGGVRGEYTYRKVTSSAIGQEFSIDRWDIFPSAHASYKLSKESQFMTSYSRRIERPRGWYLEPFLTWTDAYNVRSGNPDVKPEYIDSYEAGFQQYFGSNMLSIEAYYRVTKDKIERVQTVYDENVLLHSPDNIGDDFALGIEASLNYELFESWNFNLMANMYDYRIESEVYADGSRESFNWSLRFNNTIKIGDATRFQFNAGFESPTVGAQGTREGNIVFNTAIRQEFLNNQFAVTLQGRDIFSTANHEFTNEGPTFYTYYYMERKAPVITMTLSYNFNNFKSAELPTGRDMPGMDSDFE